MTPGRTFTTLAAGLVACGLTFIPAARPALAEDAQALDHAQAPHECHAPSELTRLTQPLRTMTSKQYPRMSLTQIMVS